MWPTPPRPCARALRVAIATAIASCFATAPARADDALEVTVHGTTAGGYTSRTSVDTAIREPIDAASLLEELPSVHVRRLGAEGSFASLSVRGSAPSQVGVVLGGIPLTSAADPALDVGALPLWPGASFRVYRGFAPAALGTTGYLGGVLAIDPPSPAVGGRTEWSVLGGSFGSAKIRIGDLRRVNGVETGTGFFASRSDGDFPYLIETPLGSGKLTELTRQNAGQTVVGGIERVAIERPWGSVAALIFADARRLGVPGSAEVQTHFATLSTSRIVVGLEASRRTGRDGAIRALAWGRRETSALDDPLGELDPTHASTTKSAIEAAGFSVGWRGRPHARLLLGVLLDGRGERFVPGAAQGFDPGAPTSRLAAGAGTDVEWQAAPSFTVSATARIDVRRDAASGVLAPRGEPAGITTDAEPTGHAGVSYRFADELVVSAHAGALARPPSFQELYGNGASLLANPSLVPERALSADVGLHGDAGSAAHLRLGYELVGFVTAASDLITFSPIGRGTFRAVNIDRALLGGAEVTASLAARGVRLELSYTLLLSENLSDTLVDALAHGDPLPGRPQHDLAYDAAYRFGPARVRYGLDVVAGVTVGAIGPVALPPRVVQSVGGALDVPFAPGLRAAVDVQNLFDVRTLAVHSDLAKGPILLPASDFLGFPVPGRTVWASLRFTRAVSQQ